MSTPIYLKNCSPTSAVQGKIAAEAWFGEKIALSHMCVFECAAFKHVPKESRKKRDSKSIELVFVSYCTEAKGYCLLNPDKPTNYQSP